MNPILLNLAAKIGMEAAQHLWDIWKSQKTLTIDDLNRIAEFSSKDALAEAKKRAEPQVLKG